MILLYVPGTGLAAKRYITDAYCARGGRESGLGVSVYASPARVNVFLAVDV